MAEAKPTLLLIDGHSLAFRAFYALNADSFRTPEGQHTNAVHGFLSMLLSLLERERPTHLLVAFDVSRESFRTREYPAYKATRTETPPEFTGQTELLHEVLNAMNIRSLGIDDFEADDILATAALKASQDGYRVLIVSGDRDTFQLISPDVTILYPIKGVLNLARMDDSAVLAKYGVHATQYPDIAALVGESSDNLVGVPGVGPKTAAKWIAEYGSLENLLKHSTELPGKVGESLRAHTDAAIRNRRLNELRRDVPLDLDFPELKLRSVDEAKIRDLFAKLGFRSLLTSVLKLRGENGTQVLREGSNAHSAEPVMGEVPQAVVAVPELPDLGSPISSAQMDELYLAGKVLFAEIEQHTIVGIGFAGENSRCVWDGVDPRATLSSLSKYPLRAWDSKSLHRALLAAGYGATAPEDDGLLAAYLVNPVERDYSLPNLAHARLGVELPKSEVSLVSDSDPSIPAWAASCLLRQSINELGQTGQLGLYREIELPLVPVLAQMEHVGIAIDVTDLRGQVQQLDADVGEIAQEAYRIAGREINLSSPKQLQTLLFDELGMPPTRAIKTGQSTNAEALADLLEQTGHPFLERLLAHRDVVKIKQMAEGLERAVASDGRIHTRFSQVGTATGRLSSDSPNLQNIPIKSERGALLRRVFRSGEAFEGLLSADYSQIEMRIMAHLSEDEGLIDAYASGEDLHRFVGARIYGVEPDQVDSTMRSKVKAMSYGLVYGLSEYGLARQLRIPRAEAKQLMADYFSRFGGVKRYLDRVVDAAKADGFTQTVMGRRRPFPDLNSKIFQVREMARRAALNAPIQGTAADIMKLAMIRVVRQLTERRLNSRLLLQVHDELILEVAPGERGEVAELVQNEMSGVVKLRVPLEVQVGFGPNWSSAAH